MTEDNNLEIITKENSFWKLYKVCRKLKTSKDNLIVFVLSLLYFYTLNMYSFSSNNELISEITLASTNLISWSVSLIGFALSGYAIFATLSEKKMQLRMAFVTDENNNISYLKSTHCTFMRIIIDMISIVLLTFLLTNKHLLEHISISIPDLESGLSITNATLCLMLGWIQSLLILEIMLAKSFVYNVYHSIMVSIRWAGTES
ncbi:hypothetical protein [Shewanella sp. KCT]|uniref:hypothetical protein n=1 Tax=Shewanella sp. KCT TaxID=2569535 RepID=UPI001182CD2B|nr:hypothetical protein [Shewanella sp. KCT]TVP14285.1 hypothetical protein AYI87_10620 [Shewanella sp. KCT]